MELKAWQLVVICLVVAGVGFEYSSLLNSNVPSYSNNNTLSTMTWSELANTSVYHTIIPVFGNNQITQTIGANEYVLGTLADTFAIHFEESSNVTLKLVIMNINQYNQYVATGIENVTRIQTGKNINFWFNESEGCSGYVDLLTSLNGESFSYEPNDSVEYRPSPVVTGFCIQTTANTITPFQ